MLSFVDIFDKEKTVKWYAPNKQEDQLLNLLDICNIIRSFFALLKM